MRISDWSSDVCSSDLLGLRKALAPQQFARSDRPQVAPLLCLGSEFHDRGSGPVGAEIERGTRLADRPHLFADDDLLPGAGVAAAIFAGPVPDDQVAFGKPRIEPARMLHQVDRTNDG